MPRYTYMLTPCLTSTAVRDCVCLPAVACCAVLNDSLGLLASTYARPCHAQLLYHITYRATVWLNLNYDWPGALSTHGVLQYSNYNVQLLQYCGCMHTRSMRQRMPAILQLAPIACVLSSQHTSLHRYAYSPKNLLANGLRQGRCTAHTTAVSA